MRELTDHKAPGRTGSPAEVITELNDALTIQVLDEPGAGGACHDYRINWGSGVDGDFIPIVFQNGPIKEGGVNGVSQEAVLAILIDRLRSFQAGEYACEHNAHALEFLQGALKWLKARTRERMRRGVEGTNQI